MAGLSIDDWVHRIDLDTAPWVGEYAGSLGNAIGYKHRHLRTALQLALDFALPVLGSLTVNVGRIELPGVSAPRDPNGARIIASNRHIPYAGPASANRTQWMVSPFRSTALGCISGCQYRPCHARCLT